MDPNTVVNLIAESLCIVLYVLYNNYIIYLYVKTIVMETLT